MRMTGLCIMRAPVIRIFLYICIKYSCSFLIEIWRHASASLAVLFRNLRIYLFGEVIQLFFNIVERYI